MPLEQAVGVSEFAGVVVTVADGVFVPRSRAEAIVDAAEVERPDARVVVDLGCGSGALAAALSNRLPGAAVHAVDIDPAAVAVAQVNGDRFGFTVHHGSWWSGLPADLIGTIDLAVGYLPHVPTDDVERIHADFRAHEPVASVAGGADGLDHVRVVLGELDQWLAPGGRFITLLSTEQAAAIGGRVIESGDDAVVVLP